MRKTLSAVAGKLHSWGYLDRHEHHRNEDTMEIGEPTRWFIYSMPYKYQMRLKPEAFPHYNPARSANSEISYILRRVFNYEVPLVAAV